MKQYICIKHKKAAIIQCPFVKVGAYLWMLLVFTILTSHNAFATGNLIDIKGQIVNENGDGVEGVTVSIKGTNRITTSDKNGNFSINAVDSDATILFTSVNMESLEIKAEGKTYLLINLKTKVTALGGITVEANTGYQTVNPNEVNGSLVVLDNKVLNQQVGTNILKRLNSVTSSLLFDVGKSNPNNKQSGMNISIRGLSTINGPLNPLIVLDGYIYEGNIENINPNDVENITVLKDAAATSIWGARAGNGVIVITTKKGRFNQKTELTASAGILVNEKPDLGYLPQMASSDYIDVEQFLFQKGFYDSRINSDYQALTPAVEIFLKRRNGLISSSDSASQINALKSIDTRDEYNNYVYRNAVTQQYSINLRGGSSSNAYIFSIGYDKNAGELRNQNRKLNVRVENSFKPLKNIQLNVGVYYTNSEARSGMTGYNSIRPADMSVPYFRLADENGVPLAVATSYRESYVDTAGGGKLLNWKFYPLEDYKHDKSSTGLQEIFATAGVKYKLTEYLDIDLKYQFQKQQSLFERISDLESFTSRSTVNLYSQLDRATGIINYVIPLGAIRTIESSELKSHTGRAQLNIHRSWENHDFSAILGSEMRQSSQFAETYTIYGFNADPLTYSKVDFINPYRTFITGRSQTISGFPAILSNSTNRFVSLYANASYTFRKRYSLSASGRRDGSNIFGANTNDKWKPLWSIGGGWKISNESFYNSSFLTVLKLRATYGHSGNIDVSKSALAVGKYYSGSDINLPYVQITTLNNPSLRWETVGMTNIGLDFTLRNEIITGSIEYYKKKGTDLYGPAPFDYTAWGGSSTLMRNVADMEGSGVNVILNSKNLDNALKWHTNFLFNYNTDKTTRYEEMSSQSIARKLGGGTSISPVIGKPLYAIAAYKWAGLDASGNPQGILDGQTSTDYQGISSSINSITYVGPSSPQIFGAFINTFAWKNFSITANISYKFRYYFQKNSFLTSDLLKGSGHKDYENRWQKPGDELITNIPAFIYPVDARRDAFYALSEINVLKADHLRLQYVQLSYSLRPGLKQKLPFNDIQVYMNASNLGIIWKANKENLDPDYPASLKSAKLWAWGIRANF